MPDYWQRVRDLWGESVDAAERGTDEPTGPMRRQWFPFLPLPTYPIAITGARGVGKSVLADALRGRTSRPGYRVPTRSTDTEDHRIKTGGRRKVRSHISVVPGQTHSTEREDILDELFREDHARPRGVIHVVSWGHDLIWGESVQRSLTSERASGGEAVDADALRAKNLAAEFTDFQATAELLYQTWSEVSPRASDIWLVIAVTKCDLYWPQIKDARRYYLPRPGGGGDTEFTAEVRQLVARLTERRLKRLAILPVSTLARDQDLAPGTIVRSDMPGEKRAALLSRLRTVIGEFNGK